MDWVQKLFRNTAFHILAFQVGWMCCVWGAGVGRPLLGPVYMSVFLSLHLLAQEERGREAVYLLATGLIGGLLDSLLVLQGSLRLVGEGLLWEQGTTLWMLALWMGFAATLRGAMAWLKERYFLSFFLGALAGPLSYQAGERLGAAWLEKPWGLVLVAVEWGLAMPLLLFLAWQVPRLERPMEIGELP